MPSRPVFVATHPRACSTAFSRVFLTRRDILEYFHEPFGDPYFFGPERAAARWRDDEEARAKSGLATVTYKDVVDQFAAAEKEGKRPFVKDMAYTLIPRNTCPGPITVAPSLGPHEPDNITTLPMELLQRFQFVFLIRHPRHAIPSMYRCTIPPLSATTGFSDLLPTDLAYEELRWLFDFALDRGLVKRDDVIVVDADGMLGSPEETIAELCRRVNIDFDKGRMLEWTDQDRDYAAQVFEKWKGWHEDALESNCLRARTQPPKELSEQEENDQWKAKYGEEAQKLMRKYVDGSVPHYEHLRAFAFNV